MLMTPAAIITFGRVPAQDSVVIGSDVQCELNFGSACPLYFFCIIRVSAPVHVHLIRALGIVLRPSHRALKLTTSQHRRSDRRSSSLLTRSTHPVAVGFFPLFFIASFPMPNSQDLNYSISHKLGI